MSVLPRLCALPVLAAVAGLPSVRAHPPASAPAAGPAPFGAIASREQLRWHALEFYGFIHFTINTFTDKEWGFGDESAALFNPTEFDARQWARVARAAGMRALILIAKHHDGFCLWPSRYTDHSVARSPWRNGRGDVVREFVDACRAEGLLPGLYVSPWDRNHAEYGRPAYLEYFRNQWRELIENYGPFFEIWQDGANGGDGFYGGARETRRIDRATYYQWPETNRLLLQWNPGAIIFSDAGPGCRWVGNEAGHSDEESWQTINLDGMFPGMSHDHLARGDRRGSHWVGVECDVSIRPGWFYHAAEDGKVKSPKQLVELWYASVGRGANLLLNLPPDRRGRIPEVDVRSLEGMRAILDRTFAVNLAAASAAVATSVWADDPRFAAANALDGDPATYWVAAEGTLAADFLVSAPQPIEFNTVRLCEAIALGQRIESFTLEVPDGRSWRIIARGSTVGPRRILRVPLTHADRLRLRIASALASPTLAEIGVYRAP